jgi:plastocyanin
MRRTFTPAIVLTFCLCLESFGSGLSGKVIFDKNLTRRTVRAAVYDIRGVAVREDVMPVQTSSEFDRVAVWLESPSTVSASAIFATMRQRRERFEPELLVVPVGSTVAFPNFDAIFHNIFSLSRAQSFDLGYYAEGKSRSVKFVKPGIVQVYCHVHPDMHAVIAVVSTAWFGKPRQDGTFSWSDVPPGKYTLHIWQKSVGLFDKAVMVPPNGDAHLVISLPEEDTGQ